jgi:hypothetical protein
MPVYYAGLIVFDDGVLKSWNNASGHYKPPHELCGNFIPYVNRLLPRHLFVAIDR